MGLTDVKLRPGIDLHGDLIGALGKASYAQLIAINDQLPKLTSAKSLRAACKAAASVIPGVTPRALNNRIRRYLKSGNVLDLVDRRDSVALWQTRKPVGLPKAFREFYRGLREKQQRVATAAHDELITIWRTRYDATGKYYERLPGYDRWPAANPATGLPDGWSYDNLQRAVPEHPWATTAARQGLAAASGYRPTVRTSRVGLRLGERVEFDDHQFDVKVHFAGQSRAMRPVCFGAADGLSAFAAVAVRPTLWDDAAEQKRTLTEYQFRCFVLWWLSEHGYRTDSAGTTLFTERGTAVIRADFESRLAAFTGGRVKVSAGSMFSESAHPGQYAPRGKGNFRHKAMIEGFWSILENVLGRLPGQMGSNQRLNGPAELHGREMVLAKTLDLARTLPPALAEQLMFPVLPFRTFATIAHAAMDAVLADREHDLEGWDELGLARMEWRTDSQSPLWLPASAMQSLPETERMALVPRLQGQEGLTRYVKMSRREVWERHAGELTQVGPSALCRLLSPDDAIEVTVTRQSLVEFTDTARFGPGTYRFLAQSRQRDLYPGDKFAAFFNPLTPRWLQLVDAKGAPVALLESWEAPSRNDLEGIKRQMGRQAHWESEQKIRLGGRHFDEAEMRAHLAEHNRLVADAAGKSEGGRGKEAEALARRAAEAGRAMAEDRGVRSEEREAVDAEIIDERISMPSTPEEFLAPDEYVTVPNP
jgi:hypothetical protein